MSRAGGETNRLRIGVRLVVFATVAALIGLILLTFIARPPGPVAEVQVADGRIIVIEAVTYGTNHTVGNRYMLVDRFGRWLPKPVRRFLSPLVPQSQFSLSQPALVVWVQALDPITRTNIDCQAIRVEFADEHDDLWGQRRSGHHATETAFNRGWHVFEAYPRADEELTLHITPWHTNRTEVVKIANPHRVASAVWSGETLPAKRTTNGLTIVLEQLHARTNGQPGKPWLTPSRYWEPQWRLLNGETEAAGWREPEWSTSDPLGNRGQWLGLHQPVLRYAVTFQPEVTNQFAVTLIGSLPAVELGPGMTNSIWFQTNVVAGAEIVAIGLTTSAINFFTDGEYEAVPPVPIGPPQGGSKTGWVTGSRRASPVKVLVHRGHFADRPVVYLRCRDTELAKRIGVRLRDEQGRLWPVTPETKGTPDGIMPFMLDVPPNVLRVTSEIVELKPVTAEFTVRTPVTPMPSSREM